MDIPWRIIVQTITTAAKLAAAIYLPQSQALLAVNTVTLLQQLIDNIKAKPVICTFDKTSGCSDKINHCWLVDTQGQNWSWDEKTWTKCPYYGKSMTIGEKPNAEG